MNAENSSQSDIQKRFDNKIEDLKKQLPALGAKPGNNCAANTLTNILDVLNRPELKNFYFNNLAIPLAGGFGGFKSKYDWKGPCGAVCGGSAAIGVILGGQEKMRPLDVAKGYLKAAKFATIFEEEFGSVSCQDLCGVDFSEPSGYQEYLNNKVWEKKCYKFVLFAVDQVRKIMRKELKRKWS